MKPRRAQLIKIKKVLDPIIKLMYLPLDNTIDTQNPNALEEFYSQEFHLAIVENTMGIFLESHIEDLVSQVRTEAISNLAKPIDLHDKKTYLEEVLRLYSKIEENIIEDEYGELSSNLSLFIEYSRKRDLYFEDYEELLNKLKDILREEIQFLHMQLEILQEDVSQKNALKALDLTWERSKTDLIELAKALSLCGAIKKSGKRLNHTETYQLFGDLFNIKLKNPADQLRQRADTYDVPYFLEELLEKYKEDQEFLKKKRES